jgi:ribosomal protein L12E/L44/L45/RPP1/RPP2
LDEAEEDAPVEDWLEEETRPVTTTSTSTTSTSSTSKNKKNKKKKAKEANEDKENVSKEEEDLDALLAK